MSVLEKGLRVLLPRIRQWRAWEESSAPLRTPFHAARVQSKMGSLEIYSIFLSPPTLRQSTCYLLNILDASHSLQAHVY